METRRFRQQQQIEEKNLSGGDGGSAQAVGDSGSLGGASLLEELKGHKVSLHSDPVSSALCLASLPAAPKWLLGHLQQS